jgi:hypothetical protein
LGELDKMTSEANIRLINPFAWLQEGVRFVVTLPIRLAYWSGLITYARYSEASSSTIVKILIFFVQLIGLVASIIQIWQAWEPLKNLYSQLTKQP